MAKTNSTIMLGALVGGAVAAGVNKFAPISNPMIKNGLPIVAGYLIGGNDKAKPMMVGVGAGMVGAGSNALISGFIGGSGAAVGEPNTTDLIPETIFVDQVNGVDMLDEGSTDFVNGPQSFEASVNGPQSFEASVAGNMFDDSGLPY